ncbi:hypothetical protein ZWY2020_059747 [Hordeum vulgare]|nr:hypothetical protein ZWY2020_059747 [Hordeum vulgare]
MRGQEGPTRLRSNATAGTHPPATPTQPPPPAATASGGRSRLLHLAFLCLAASTAAAWFVEPFVAAAGSRLPASAVAATGLLLAACFHLTVHLVHSFAAPCPPLPAAAAVARAAATVAVTVGMMSSAIVIGPSGMKVAHTFKLLATTEVLYSWTVSQLKLIIAKLMST